MSSDEDGPVYKKPRCEQSVLQLKTFSSILKSSVPLDIKLRDGWTGKVALELVTVPSQCVDFCAKLSRKDCKIFGHVKETLIHKKKDDPSLKDWWGKLLKKGGVCWKVLVEGETQAIVVVEFICSIDKNGTPDYYSKDELKGSRGPTTHHNMVPLASIKNTKPNKKLSKALEHATRHIVSHILKLNDIGGVLLVYGRNDEHHAEQEEAIKIVKRTGFRQRGSFCVKGYGKHDSYCIFKEEVGEAAGEDVEEEEEEEEAEEEEDGDDHDNDRDGDRGTVGGGNAYNDNDDDDDDDDDGGRAGAPANPPKTSSLTKEEEGDYFGDLDAEPRALARRTPVPVPVPFPVVYHDLVDDEPDKLGPTAEVFNPGIYYRSR